ncbi:MAG TPA: hypothetical protein VIL69_17760 [Roseomonas sp.]
MGRKGEGIEEFARLGVDFAAPQPEAVTQLLAAQEAEEVALRLTLAGRIGALAGLLRRLDPAAELPLALRCATCGEGMEAALPLTAIVEMAEAAEAQPVLSLPRPEGGTLRLRRPTGEDQRLWRARAYADETEAALSICASLLLDPAPLDEADLPALGEAMAEADPLPGFHIGATCPACGAAAEAALDLEAALLAQFAQHQRALLDEVHLLASRYGWTEAEILAVPPHRRRAYLTRIGEAMA